MSAYRYMAPLKYLIVLLELCSAARTDLLSMDRSSALNHDDDDLCSSTDWRKQALKVGKSGLALGLPIYALSSKAVLGSAGGFP